jgi:hypothetical protein
MAAKKNRQTFMKRQREMQLQEKRERKREKRAAVAAAKAAATAGEMPVYHLEPAELE